MKTMRKGLLLALLHLAIICTLGAKLLYDRAYRPRVWVKTAPADPNLPIRGRYLSLHLEVPAEGFSTRSEPSSYEKDKDGKPVIVTSTFPYRGDLVLRNGVLIAVANDDGEFWISAHKENDGFVANVSSDTAFFIPEHAVDPSRRPKGEELWIEATIPRKGPPRPIRLGVKKNGAITPLVTE